MEWRGAGILLSVRKHGETSAIAELFTGERGRWAGVVRGASSRTMAPVLQPGAQLDAVWRARLDDHIGTFTLEPLRSRAAMVMGDRLALAGLNAVVSLVSFCLPEREAYPDLYTQTMQVLDLLGQDEVWPLAYLHWERRLLEDAGYGLDLSACAVTGSVEDLAFISPKTGRAVSREGAGDWADRLLPLPPILLGDGVTSDAEIKDALAVTGHFLTHKLAPDLGNRPLPEARARLMSALDRL